MANQVASPYPLILRGELTAPINRWQFLVKWILLIPHVVVLVFLYIGFVVAWLMALFAILFTGRYPRTLFTYNVGVMRWSWRVGFYSYEALGTDRYPPFSLASVPSYPADLTVEYPEKLSQPLVLVKWWLLAIPHYLIVNVLEGGLGWWWGGGLLFLLVLFAAVANLFTGRYPGDIFALVMSANRWVYRVWAYASLMTDQYPPFRLGE